MCLLGLFFVIRVDVVAEKAYESSVTLEEHFVKAFCLLDTETTPPAGEMMPPGDTKLDRIKMCSDEGVDDGGDEE